MTIDLNLLFPYTDLGITRTIYWRNSHKKEIFQSRAESVYIAALAERRRQED